MAATAELGKTPSTNVLFRPFTPNRPWGQEWDDTLGEDDIDEKPPQDV